MTGEMQAAAWGLSSGVLAFFLARVKRKSPGSRKVLVSNSRREPYDG